jgi:hypothetical protein
MADIIGLVLPFFGLIFLGFFVARITRQPVEALGWMNTFIVYVALPALFFQLLAKTPFEQLTEWTFILGSVLSTYFIFTLMFAGSRLIEGSSIAESTIKSLAAAYGNIGYMGPGLALLVFGPEAAVPVALIFCFENIVHFAVAPMMMALSGGEKQPPTRLLLGVLRKIVLHPFIIATAAGVAAAYLQLRPPLPMRAASRISLGRGRALRAFRHGRDARAPAVEAGTEGTRPDRRPQADPAPAGLLRRLELGGQFLGSLAVFRRPAGGAAHGHQRLRSCPTVSRLGRAGLGQHPADHLFLSGDRHRAALPDQQRDATARPVPVDR